MEAGYKMFNSLYGHDLKYKKLKIISEINGLCRHESKYIRQLMKREVIIIYIYIYDTFLDAHSLHGISNFRNFTSQFGICYFSCLTDLIPIPYDGSLIGSLWEMFIDTIKSNI